MTDYTLEPIYERVSINKLGDDIPITEYNITWERMITTSAIMYTIMYFMFSVAACITTILICSPLASIHNKQTCSIERYAYLMTTSSIVLGINFLNILCFISSCCRKNILIAYLLFGFLSVSSAIFLLIIIIYDEMKIDNSFIAGDLTIMLIITLILQIIKEAMIFLAVREWDNKCVSK